jgi:hypothetical protein
VKLKDPIYCDESYELLLGQLIVCIRTPALDQENETQNSSKKNTKHRVEEYRQGVQRAS